MDSPAFRRTIKEANLASSEHEVLRLNRVVGRLEAQIHMLTQELIKERKARRALEANFGNTEEKAPSPHSAAPPPSPAPHEGSCASTSSSCSEVYFPAHQVASPPPPTSEAAPHYLPTPPSACAELTPDAFPTFPTFPYVHSPYTSSPSYTSHPPYHPHHLSTSCTRHESFAAPSHPTPAIAYSFPLTPQDSYAVGHARPSLVVNTGGYPSAEVKMQQQVEGSWWDLGVGEGGDWGQSLVIGRVEGVHRRKCVV